MSKNEKLYAERDIMALDDAGNYYLKHVSAMTGEKLHGKSDIAAELAHRDYEIDQLKAQVKQLRGNEIEVAADAYWKGYVAGGDDFRSRINIPLEVVTKKANELIVKLYPESESAKKIRQATKAGE